MAWAERRRLADGSAAWYGLWRDPATGGRRCEPLGACSEAQARAWAKQAGVDLEGRRPRPVPLAPGQILARFLARKRLDGCRPDTIRFFRERLEPLLSALAGMAPWPRWTPDHLRAFLRSHPDWEPRTVQMHVGAARALIRFAAEQGTPCPDFAAGVRAPRVRTKDAPHYNAAQVVSILGAAEGTSVELGAALGLLAGLDYATMRALLVSQVNLRAGWIRGARGKEGRQPFAVKILPRLAEILRRRMPKRGLVCVGMPKSRDNAARALRRVERAAGVPTGGWHRLRHSYGSALAEAGADIPTIRLLMGHAPGSPMPLRYVHSDEKRAAAASAKMGRLLRDQ